MDDEAFIEEMQLEENDFESRLQVNIENVENLFTGGCSIDGQLESDLFIGGGSEKWRRSKERGINRKFKRIKKQARKLCEEISDMEEGRYGLLRGEYDHDDM
jgi:flagellar capping protein FliD